VGPSNLQTIRVSAPHTQSYLTDAKIFSVLGRWHFLLAENSILFSCSVFGGRFLENNFPSRQKINKQSRSLEKHRNEIHSKTLRVLPDALACHSTD
jgi:hypothetical protein